MGESTARSAIWEVYHTSSTRCWYLCFTNPQEVKAAFCQNEIPSSLGLLGMHVLTLYLMHYGSEDINCFGFFSVGLHGVIDHSGPLTHMITRWFGKVWDLQVSLMMLEAFTRSAPSTGPEGVAVPETAAWRSCLPAPATIYEPTPALETVRKELFSYYLGRC